MKNRGYVSASIYKTNNTAFIISFDDCQRIFDKISQYYSIVIIRFSCNDGSIIEDQTTDCLRKHENIHVRKITTIEFSAHTDPNNQDDPTSRYYSKMSFEFYSDTSSHSKYRIEEISDERAVLIRNELEGRIKSYKPWYGIIAKTHVSSVFLACLFSFSIVTAYKNIFFGNRNLNQHNENLNIYSLIDTYVFLLSIAFTLYLLTSKLKKYLFPEGLFLIGKEIQKNATREKVRWWTTTSCIIPLVIFFIKIIYSR